MPLAFENVAVSKISIPDDLSPPMNLLVLSIPLFGLLALAYTFWRSAWVTKQNPGTERMQQIGGFIAEGAMAFLRTSYHIHAIP